MNIIDHPKKQQRMHVFTQPLQHEYDVTQGQLLNWFEFRVFCFVA